MCGHTGSCLRSLSPIFLLTLIRQSGTTFALYTSSDLEEWTLNTTNVIPDKPGGDGANLYTPVLSYNAQFNYYVMLFQCTGGCTDGQLQVSIATSPAGPFKPKGAVLPSHVSSNGNMWVDASTGKIC